MIVKIPTLEIIKPRTKGIGVKKLNGDLLFQAKTVMANETDEVRAKASITGT